MNIDLIQSILSSYKQMSIPQMEETFFVQMYFLRHNEYALNSTD